MSIEDLTAWQVLLGCMIGTFAICINMTALVIVVKINEKVDEADRISYLWWNVRILKIYKKLYPAGRLYKLYKSCVLGMVLCWVTLAVSLAFRKSL